MEIVLVFTHMGRNNDAASLGRRTFLSAAATGTLLGSLGVQDALAITSNEQYVLTQGDREVVLEPLANGEPVEEFYGSKRADGNGYELDTSTGVEASDTANVFLYEAPDGTVSLVTTLDEAGDGTGGSATVTYDNLPREGGWTVADDRATDDFSSRGEVSWTWSGSDGDGGTFGPFDIDSRGIALEERLKIQPDGYGEKISLSNPWHYFRRFDQPLEGYDPPVYVAVLADNADFDSQPPQDQPKQSFRIDGEQVVPDTSSSNEPTNDIFFVVKPYDDRTELKFLAESAGYDNRIWFDDEVLIENTNYADTNQTFTFETPSEAVTVTPTFHSGISAFRALSGSASSPDVTELDPSQPVTFSVERVPETDVDLQPLVDAKRDKIGTVRSQAVALLGDYDTNRDPAKVDAAAKAYVDDLEPRIGGLSKAEGRANQEVLERLNAGEQVSTKALGALNFPVGLENQDVISHFADASVDAISSVVLAGVFGKLGRLGRGSASAATRKLVQSQTFEDFVVGLNRHADSVVLGFQQSDEAYQAIYRNVARDQLAYFDLWEAEGLGDGVGAIYTNAIKNGARLPGFGEGEALAEASFFTQVAQMKEDARRFVEQDTYETALYRGDGVPNQMPVEFPETSVDIPNVPDSLEVPYADEVEDAANTVLGWIEEAAESLGEIEALPSVNIQELEDIEIDIPDEIELPDVWNLPDEVGIESIEIDAGRVLNQLDELLPGFFSGIDAELEEEVAILLDKLEEGELGRQPDEVRGRLVEVFSEFYDALKTGMDVMFTGYDVLDVIGEIAELIAFGVAGAVVLIVTMLALLGIGLSLVLIPLVGIYLEIIGLLNGMVAAVEGLTGYAFLSAVCNAHSAAETVLLNTELEGLEEVV